MTLAEFFGCGLLGFGPPLAIIVITVAHDPVRIILMIAAAFAWLLSLSLSSILWFAVVPLRGYLVFGLVFSIFFQELLRFGLYKLLRKFENELKKFNENQVAGNKHMLALVAGLGFGLMSGVFAYINVLSDSIGPGTVGLKSGTEYFFLTSAVMTLCMILLHSFWNVVFFNALDRRDLLSVTWVVGSHILVSSLTLLNKWELYVATIVPAYVILSVTIVLAYRSVGATYKSFLHSFSTK